MLALFYDYVDDYLERRGPLREEHLRRVRDAHDGGDLALAGAFTDPPDRALLVWRTDDRAVVERFVEQDPYVRGGIVTRWEVRGWNLVIGET